MVLKKFGPGEIIPEAATALSVLPTITASQTRY